MKTGALATILVCELLIITMMSVNISSSALSFISTLVIVVIVAFSISALLQNIKTLKASKKYGISGVLGVLIGLLYYWWASDHFTTLVTWLQTYGMYFLFIIIFLCALFLYAYKDKKKETSVNQHLTND
ncbi:hypothetical protein [Wenyingzhuangia sp. IMCC45467]